MKREKSQALWRKAAGLMPLVFWATSEKRRYFVFFPLVWDFDYKAERRARRYYGPFYTHQDEKGWRLPCRTTIAAQPRHALP